MKTVGLLLTCLALSFAAWANGTPALKLQLDAPQEEYILGIRPECNLRWINMQDDPLVLAFEVSSFSPLVKVHIQGQQRKDCRWTNRTAEWSHTAHEELKPHEKKLEWGFLGDKGLVELGDYEAWVEYDSTGLEDYWLQWGVARIKTESNHIRFRIVSPKGEDAAILLKHSNSCHQVALSKSEILRLYPTSTYAAYAVYDCMKAFITSNWRMAAEGIEARVYGSQSVPDDTGLWKDGWQSLSFEAELKWWDKWIGIILKNHPDIWFADQLKLKRALDQLALKKYDAGAADLQALARDAKEPVANAAKEFLGIMKEKGWIKAEPAASAPPAAPVPEKTTQAPVAPEKAAPTQASTPTPDKPPGGRS